MCDNNWENLKAQPTPARRVLLAEDSIDSQVLVAYLIRKMGHQIEIAENGKVALAMVEQADRSGTPYDLLLSDMHMPEMDGYTLARILRKRRNPIPIVAITAHTMAEDRDKCLSAGCHDYISKPVDQNKLTLICELWLEAGQQPIMHAV